MTDRIENVEILQAFNNLLLLSKALRRQLLDPLYVYAGAKVLGTLLISNREIHQKLQEKFDNSFLNWQEIISKLDTNCYSSSVRSLFCECHECVQLREGKAKEERFQNETELHIQISNKSLILLMKLLEVQVRLEIN